MNVAELFKGLRPGTFPLWDLHPNSLSDQSLDHELIVCVFIPEKLPFHPFPLALEQIPDIRP